MAGGSRNVSGTLLRLLQLGVDKEIEHFSKDYVGPYAQVFDKVTAAKGFYEIVELSGMGPAGLRTEGQVTTNFDTINQDFNPRYTIFTYEKSARASEEAIDDNLYESLPSRMAQCIAGAHEVNKDIQAASILNNSTVTTWGDGSALMSTSHSLQAGGTNSNRLSPDLDLSADAIQTAIIGIQAFKNPNGLLGEYYAENLIIPPALQFIADIAVNSKYKPGSDSNSINPVNRMGLVTNVVVWRRLTSASTWFLTTNQRGLVMAEKGGMKNDKYMDQNTHDTVVTSRCRFRVLVEDHRCLIGSVGP